MARHTTFRYRLDPTVEQEIALARHTGASRFAFNQCLQTVKSALTERKDNPAIVVPWTGFDLINCFNAWKKTEGAGRVFSVSAQGVAEVVVTGLVWRNEVFQQVFEEAAADCGRALAAWSDSRCGKRKGRRVGFPQFKKKARTVPSFRIRNRHSKRGRPTIQVGDCDGPRSITLPSIGSIRVHDDTRPLRRMLAKDRAKVLFVTVSRRAGHWWVAVNVEAADLHPAHHHPVRAAGDYGGWVGVDRGLSQFLIAATAQGDKVGHVADAPKPIEAGLRRQRQLSKSLSRKQKGSSNRRRAVARLSRHHWRIANVRRHFLHRVSNNLVKTHDRLVLENLNIAGMLANHHLSRAIADAGWGEFARMLRYKSEWRGGQLVLADRWYPSSKRCSACGLINPNLMLADRQFSCICGNSLDRDLNAAINLAQWATNQCLSDPRTAKHGGRVTNARRRDGADRHPRVGETVPDDVGTYFHAAPTA